MINKTLNRILKGKQRITFDVTNGKRTVKVVLEGDGRCCREIRDNIIVWGPNSNWVQGDLYREVIGEDEK